METFTIDADENISFGTGEGDAFSSEEELLAVLQERNFSKEDVTALWNSFAETPGFADCKAQKKIKNRPAGVAKIWEAIQRLVPESAKSCGAGAGAALDYHENASLADGESFVDDAEINAGYDKLAAGYIGTDVDSASPSAEENSGLDRILDEVEQAESDADAMAAEFAELPEVAGEVTPGDSAPSGGKGLAARVKDALAEEKPAKTRAKAAGKPAKAPKASKAAKTTGETKKRVKGAGTAHEGSKTARVIALMQRKSGVTLSEFIEATGWKGTTTSFLTRLAKGHEVVAFKTPKDENAWRIESA